MKRNNKFLKISLNVCVLLVSFAALSFADEYPDWEVAGITQNRDSIRGAIEGIPNLQDGDPIAAFDENGNCYGVGHFDGTNFWMSTYMREEPNPDKPGDTLIPGFEPGEEVVFKVYSVIDGEEYTLLQSSGDPYIYEFHGMFPPKEIALVYEGGVVEPSPTHDDDNGDNGGDGGDDGTDDGGHYGDDIGDDEEDEESDSEKEPDIIYARPPGEELLKEEKELPPRYPAEITQPEAEKETRKIYYKQSSEKGRHERYIEGIPPVPTEETSPLYYEPDEVDEGLMLSEVTGVPILAEGEETLKKRRYHVPLALKIIILILVPITFLVAAQKLGLFGKK